MTLVPVMARRQSNHSAGSDISGSIGNLTVMASPVETFHSRHDAASVFGAVGEFNDHLLFKPRFKAVNQHARRSQTCKLDLSARSKRQDCSERHEFEVQTSCEYIFSKITKPQEIPLPAECIQKLKRNEVHLALVRHGWAIPCEVAMPHETSGMRVTLDAETFPKVETALGLLAETVFVIAGKTRDVARQGYIDPASQMTTVHLPLNSRG